MNTHKRNVLVGILTTVLSDAEREGRTGPWVDTVAELLAEVSALRPGQAPTVDSQVD